MLNFLLLLYGVTLGLPDIAFRVVNTNFRLDDLVLIILFSFVLIKSMHKSYHLTKTQIIILNSVLIFAFYCIQSTFIGLFKGLPFDFYSFIRMLACTIMFITFLFIIDSRKIRWVSIGLLIGSILFILQFLLKYKEIMNYQFEYYYQIKTELSFVTWNPNNTANTAIMFSFILILFSFKISGIIRIIVFILISLLSMIPFLVFSRGAIFEILIITLTFILINSKNKEYKYINRLLFFIIFASLGYLIFFQSRFLIQAFSINFITGEGLSSHDIMWETALKLIPNSLLFGHGFGQEIFLYKEILGSGMSHNAFLSVFLECGLIGLIIFIFPFIYMVYKFYYFLKVKSSDISPLICLSFLMGLFVLNLSQSASYWYKQQMLIFTIMTVYIGFLERNIT